MENAYNSELKYIFSNVNEMLKFGEAKHSGLIVFNAALSVAFFANYEKLSPHINEFNLILGALAFCFSIFTSFITLFPVTRNLFLYKKEVQNPNLLFYGDLAELDLDTFIEELKIKGKDFSPNKIDIDLMKQILIISRIVKDKFKFYKISLVFTLIGLVSIGIPSIISLFF